jgi:hypothetical protein
MRKPPRDSARRKIRPALSLRIVLEIKNDFSPLGIIQRSEEFFRRSDNRVSCANCRRARIGKRVRDRSTDKEQKRSENDFVHKG